MLLEYEVISTDLMKNEDERKKFDVWIVFFKDEMLDSLRDMGLNLEKVISYLKASGNFEPLAGDVSSLVFVDGQAIVFVGFSPRTEERDLGRTLELMRISGGLLSDKLKESFKRSPKIGFLLPRIDNKEVEIKLLATNVEGILLKSFSDHYLKSKDRDKIGHPLNAAKITFFVPHPFTTAVKQELHQVITMVKWTNRARWLSNLPPNIATPTFIANKITEFAKDIPSVHVEVLTEEECQKLGMGSFLGVTRGTDEPAKFIKMEYRHENAINEKPFVFVGKGITFDSGGISLKGREGMERMKHDMQGAAVVQSLIFCVAELELPIHVIGITPLTENMPSGRAYKPADVVTALNGKTIEIISTDSEGRMILADALAYAVKYLDPELIIDVATLTGGVVVALGGQAMGLFSNDEQLARELLELSWMTERAWRLPLWEEYDEYLKTDVADFKNTAGMVASPVNAARLLSHFVDDRPWVHLDIAGMAWDPPAPRKKYLGKGATGAAHRLLTRFLIRKCEENH